MTDPDDVRLAIAELKGMLGATLPSHAARLDEHDRLLVTLAATQVQQGQDIASVVAVAAERAAAHRTTPPWVGVAALLVAAAAVIVTIILAS